MRRLLVALTARHSTDPRRAPAPGPGRARPGRPGHRRPVLPGLRQRRVRRLPLRHPAALLPGDRPAHRHHHDPGPGHRRTSAASTSTSCSTSPSVRVNGRAADVRPRRATTSWSSPRPRRSPRASSSRSSCSTRASRQRGRAAGYTAWTRTSDGALAVGQPEIAWWWFPSNDHPLGQGHLRHLRGRAGRRRGAQQRRHAAAAACRRSLGWTRWSWRSAKPMATYLAFMAIGQYEIVHGHGARTGSR